jgi:hypothetical protein
MIEEKEKMKKPLEAAYKQAARDDCDTYKEWEDTIKDGLEDEAR